MRAILTSAIIGLALTVCATSNAQAPAGSTGECKDGTYTTSESKKGACGGHGGVKDWYDSAAPAKKSGSVASAPAAAKTSAPATAAAAPVPAGSTGECKDGTYTSTETKKGACGGHGGVKDWYGASASAKGGSAPAPAAAKASAPATAAAASVPSGSTGQCKDGTYTSAETKQGACGGHGGVKDWYGSAAPAKASDAPATVPAAAKASAAAPMAAAAPAPAAKASTSPMAAAPAAGGGPGQVWVNTNSKVYHCPGTEWYGKTKAGEYMTESAAKAAGNHADHGKACS